MSASDVPSATPAGWYPDPADPNRLRRWDGRNWTDEVVIATGTPAAAPAAAAAPAEAAPEPEKEPEPEKRPETDEIPKAGATSLPEWATLPGLTLPPDLSGIPGLSSSPGLLAPSFDEPAREQPPQPVSTPDAPPPVNPSSATTPPATTPPATTPPGTAPPVTAQVRSGATLANSPAPQTRRELRALREMQGEQPSTSAPAAPQPPAEAPAEEPIQNTGVPRVTGPAPTAPERETAPAESASYAPPPAGAQYVAPPPPGVAYTPPTQQQAPFNFGMVPSSSLASAAVRNEGIENGHPSTPTPVSTGTSPTAAARRGFAPAPRADTLGVWLIAVLPLLHFAVLYVVFKTLAQTFIPGTQWGLLAAPAIFSLLFAVLDRRTLAARGQESIPGTILAIIPPLYLIVRCSKVGRRSALPLVVWILLQAVAVVGALTLLSTWVSAAF